MLTRFWLASVYVKNSKLLSLSSQKISVTTYFYRSYETYQNIYGFLIIYMYCEQALHCVIDDSIYKEIEIDRYSV